MAQEGLVMTYREDRRKRLPNHCAICGKLVYVTPGKGTSWGWSQNTGFTDTAAIGTMVQVHLECLFNRIDQMKEGA